MKMNVRFLLLIAMVLFAMAPTAGAATFVVPSDRDMVGRSRLIVVASALESHVRKNDDGMIETVTTFTIEETIKGRISAETVTVVEPGGVLDDEALVIPGVPRFRAGERLLLFLGGKPGRWAVTDFALGSFTIASDERGRRVISRQSADINGWTLTGNRHEERLRDAAKFLDFVRATARGEEASDDYLLPLEEHRDEPKAAGQSHSTYSALSYLSDVGGGAGIRWSSFPRTWVKGTAGVEGATNSGLDATTGALNTWENDAGSNVDHTYGGVDGTKTNGIMGSSDGANTILFDRDLSAYGAPAFSCSQGGVLGIGGIRSSGSHTGPDGVSFATGTEGDVEMNLGLDNCNFITANNGDVLGSSVAHELGHALGFRHSDQNRDSSTPCASIECSNSAIMRSSIASGLNSVLQTYDINAVRAVYPNATGSAPAAPTGLSASATGTSAVTVAWTASTGATSYKIFRRQAGGSLTQIGTSAGTSYNDTGVSSTTAYLYTVRATNASGDSADSNSDFTTTVSFTDSTVTGGSTLIKTVHFTELLTAVNAVRSLAGLSSSSFTAPSAAALVTVRKAHVDDLRTALNAARTALGFASASFTDSTITAGSTNVKAVHITELRNSLF